MKRILAAVLALLMALSLASVAFAAAPVATYTVNKTVGCGEQQGIQQNGTCYRHESQAALIYQAPVDDFLRDRAENTYQQERVDT